jgi:hypothetical protein
MAQYWCFSPVNQSVSACLVVTREPLEVKWKWEVSQSSLEWGQIPQQNRQPGAPWNNVNYISLNIFMMAVEQCSICDVSSQSRHPYQLLQSPHGRRIYIILYNDVSKHDLRVFIHRNKNMWRNVKTSYVLRHACVLLRILSMFSCEGNNFSQQWTNSINI